jgi:hypothetical protein
MVVEEELRKILRERAKERQKLLKERDRLVDVLYSMEEAYLDGWITKKEFERVRRRYLRKLKKVEEKIRIPITRPPPVKKPEAVAPPPRPTYPTLSFWLIVAGLVGGVLATAGVFFPWVCYSEVMENENLIVREDLSGFDIPRRFREYPAFEWISFPVLSALVGGSLILLGLIGRLLKMPMGIAVFVGGILAAIGGIWGLAKLSGAIMSLRLVSPEISLSIGSGVYFEIAGAMLAVAGFVGLMLRG